MSALAIHIDWTGPVYAELLHSWMDVLHPGAWMNNPSRGHQAIWGMVWLGAVSRIRQPGRWREKGLVVQPPTTLGQQAPVCESSLRSMSHNHPARQGPAPQPQVFSPSSVPTMPEHGQLLPQPSPEFSCSPLSKLFTSFFPVQVSQEMWMLTALHPPQEVPGDFHVYQWDTLSIKR